MKIRYVHDEDTESPRENCDPFGTMICFHKRYRLGDKTELRSSQFDGWSELHAHLEKELGAVVILPLYLYDHSGIKMSVGSSQFQACDPVGWDWGQVGFIYCTREDVLKGWMKKRLSKSLLVKAEALLTAQVKEYDLWLQGDCWGYIVEDDEGNQLDSCWGYIGREWCEQAGAEALAACEESAHRCEA